MASTKKKDKKKGLTDAELAAKYDTGKVFDLEAALKKGITNLTDAIKRHNDKN